MNSSRIFTLPQIGEVNILLLFTEIEKNNIIVLVYTHSVISTTLFVAFFVFSGTANGGETQVYTSHFVLFGSCIIHSVGSE